MVKNITGGLTTSKELLLRSHDVNNHKLHEHMIIHLVRPQKQFLGCDILYHSYCTLLSPLEIIEGHALKKRHMTPKTLFLSIF